MQPIVNSISLKTGVPPQQEGIKMHNLLMSINVVHQQPFSGLLGHRVVEQISYRAMFVHPDAVRNSQNNPRVQSITKQYFFIVQSIALIEMLLEKPSEQKQLKERVATTREARLAQINLSAPQPHRPSFVLPLSNSFWKKKKKKKKEKGPEQEDNESD